MLTRNDGRANLPALLWEAGLTLFLVLLLDLTFDLYFWRVPKLTPRSSDYGYQFLVDVRQLSQAKAAGRLRVVAFGSSVAGSFDAAQVQSLLRAAHPEVDFEVQRLLVPGIKPSDYRLFFAARGDVLGADVAVLPLNLVDFLNPSVDRGVKPQVRKVLPAWPTLREKWSELPAVDDRLDLVFAGASHLYRYRDLLVSAAVDHARWLLRWLRARPTTAYGFFPDGYSERRLGFSAADAAGGEIEYYVDPEWIRQRGQVRLTATLHGAPVAERLESAPGWKRLHWQPGESGRLEMRLDSAWNRRAGDGDDDIRLLGVRLRPAPPDDWKRGTPPVEYPPFRDAPELLRMGAARGEAYVRRWQEILHADSEFARRMQAYYQAKTEVREETFDAGGEYAALRELVRYLVARGVAVVLVNNPESPLILPEYEDSQYYRAHRAFLRDLAARQGVHFHDLAAALPAEDFNDWHHVNYIGAIKLGPQYAAMVAAALPPR